MSKSKKAPRATPEKAPSRAPTGPADVKAVVYVELVTRADIAALRAVQGRAKADPAHRTVTTSALVRQLIRDAARQKGTLVVKLDEV